MKKKTEKNFLEKLRVDFNKIILGNIILNILFLIFGVYIYMNPYITINVVGIIIGIYFMLFGMYAIYEFFMRSETPIFTYKIFVGVLAIILGLFIMTNPFNLVKILTFALGIYLIIISLAKVLEAFKLKKLGYDGWLLVFVTSILLLIFGVFITINPMASKDIVQAAAIFIILSSILEIANLFMLYSKSKELNKLFKGAK